MNGVTVTAGVLDEAFTSIEATPASEPKPVVNHYHLPFIDYAGYYRDSVEAAKMFLTGAGVLALTEDDERAGEVGNQLIGLVRRFPTLDRHFIDVEEDPEPMLAVRALFDIAHDAVQRSHAARCRCGAWFKRGE